MSESITAPAPAPGEDMTPIITLSRNIVVRRLCESDVEEIARIANTRKILRNMRLTWPDPYTVQSSKDFLNLTNDQSRWQPIGTAPENGKDDRTKLPVAWTIAQNDIPIGGIGFKFHTDIEEREIEIGYWLGVEYWGKGIATELVKAVVPWIWETYPNIIRLEASIYSWNPASGKVLEKAGFVHEGTHKAKVWRYGEICDMKVYGLVREGITT